MLLGDVNIGMAFANVVLACDEDRCRILNASGLVTVG